MELKGYQQTNLDALDRFLSCVDQCKDTAKGFYHFWQTNDPPITPFPGTIIEAHLTYAIRCPQVEEKPLLHRQH